jgi:hypothetical protein
MARLRGRPAKGYWSRWEFAVDTGAPVEPGTEIGPTPAELP